MSNRLAYKKNCAGCGEELFMAICRDGRWRAFETDRQPLPLPFAWAWRKRVGMEETDRVAGHLLHPCPEFHDRALATVTPLTLGRHPLAEEAS